ncbi:hypothetical protein K2173_010820 [Erythroxylum novogranatense]|uniref:AAA+ ATPase domain-containing protein n=1 Tax=Erythroxylum novogranatense TaxID=1862640 RepID=A0AAV8T0S5_9ROSI|nr:hypothetical protein K2173_010820 [Erythroxylum novogranatense]
MGSTDETTNVAGDYFALATVFPSSKVFKNGVQLSSILSQALGYPANGSFVFVYPIQDQPLVTDHSDGKSKPQDQPLCSVHNCSDLYLELVTCKPGVKRENTMKHGQLDSPTCDEGTTSISSNPPGPYCELFDVKQMLEDESTKHLLQTLAAVWLHSRVVICGNHVAIPLLRDVCIYRVKSAKLSFSKDTSKELRGDSSHILGPPASELVNPEKDAFLIKHSTRVYLNPPATLSDETIQRRSSSCLEVDSEHYDQSYLVGLDEEYRILKDIILLSRNNTLESFDLRPIKGVLLYGPPGTGKTSLARLCARDAGVNLFSVDGYEIMSHYYGGSETKMAGIFDSAIRARPSMVFIDELDAIAESQRMVTTLMTLMDGTNKIDGFLVVAATNRPESIDPALRRHGRFEREIEIGVPSPVQRRDILNVLLSKKEHSLSDAQIQDLAMVTHGFVGADLAGLCNEAAMFCLRRYDYNIRNGAMTKEPSLLTITFEDFEKSRMIVKPGHMRR